MEHFCIFTENTRNTVDDTEKTRNDLMHYPPTVPNAQSRSPYDFQDGLHSSVVQVTLEQVELWREFYDVGTEMILTKAGRYEAVYW